MPNTTMIYVTHDQVEAMTLADRIVVLKDGRIEQVGSPMELYKHPGNLFVAQFIGSPAMNILPATIEQGRCRDAVVDVAGRKIDVPVATPADAAGTAISFGVRPEDLRVATGDELPVRGHGRLHRAARRSAARLYRHRPRRSSRWWPSCPAMPRSSAATTMRLAADAGDLHIFDDKGLSFARPRDRGKGRLIDSSRLAPCIGLPTRGARLLWSGCRRRAVVLILALPSRRRVGMAALTSPTRKTSMASPLPRSLCVPAGIVSKRSSSRDAVSAETAMAVVASGASTLPSPCSLWLTFTVSPTIV